MIVSSLGRLASITVHTSTFTCNVNGTMMYTHLDNKRKYAELIQFLFDIEHFNH